VPTAHPEAHLTLHVRKLQLLLLPGVQPNMIVVEDVELKTGARRTGAAAGTAGAELADTVENELLTADIGLLAAGSVHKA
jgi:hypothetical protein